MNQLYFGDCFAILKEMNSNHPAGFIGLVYIDPPFNSKRNYNILSKSKSAGYYAKELFGQAYDKIQILTFEVLQNGKRLNIPNSSIGTFKSASKKTTNDGSKQEKLF